MWFEGCEPTWGKRRKNIFPRGKNPRKRSTHQARSPPSGEMGWAVPQREAPEIVGEPATVVASEPAQNRDREKRVERGRGNKKRETDLEVGDLRGGLSPNYGASEK